MTGALIDPPEQLDQKTAEPSVQDAEIVPVSALLSSLSTDASTGLSEEVAAHRLKEHGPNALSGRPTVSAARLFFSQCKSTVVYVLLVAAVASFLTGETLQALAILAAVLINTIVGFLTEFKAKLSLEALEKLAGPLARVRRGGKEIDLPAADLVPGDLVILEAGCRVPADLRLISGNMSVDESALTGESVAVFKTSECIDDTSVSIVLQGSLVLQGHAKSIVTATGNLTQLGKLGVQLCQINSSQTPMEKSLERMGQQLSVFIVVICALVFVFGVWHKENLWEMLQASIALAVAAIPEGLPVVATLALAIGTQRMVRFGALIRKLSAVETLGCTQIICTDKTGTLTQNKMTVSDIVLDYRHLQVSGSGYGPQGRITEGGLPVNMDSEVVLENILRASSLCNDAKLENHDGAADWHVHGDPTEGALIAAATKAEIKHDDLKQSHPRVCELPFDLDRKRMTTVHRSDEGLVAFVKGSPESVIGVSTHYLTSDGPKPLGAQARAWFKEKNKELASRGLRVLGIGRRNLENVSSEDRDEVESEIVFIGLVGMADQAKEGVKEAINACHNAGIEIVMLTGDQPETANAISRELHITDAQSPAPIVGERIEQMTDQSIIESLRNTKVIARVKPEIKYSVVHKLQSAGYVVAMTGDGVNDAAALRQADIGVAMGQGGTALAREASDMVLTDDNFATIVKAIEEGRGIYKNISCAIAYLLTASLASVLAVVVPVTLDLGLPLSPLQLLWLNLIMHVFPALGLVMQPAPEGVMNEKPRQRDRALLDRKTTILIALRAILVAVTTTIAVSICVGKGTSHDQTVTMCALSVALLFQAWSWFGDRGLLKNAQRIFNVPMLINTFMGVLLLLSAVYLPAIRDALATETLPVWDWIVIFDLSVGACLLSVGLSRLPWIKES